MSKAMESRRDITRYPYQSTTVYETSTHLPQQLGIQRWHPGDVATYQLKTNTKIQRIFFAVAAEASGESQHHWLRTDGLARFNAVPITFWRLLSETSLRPGTEADGFFM